jgi:translation initiation factor 1 (eIF-1/SUI1)
MPEAVVASFAQVTLHRQTAGRAGRTVTMVTVKPPRPPAVLDALAKALRRGLGCGSHVEQDRIVLQGDISDRAQDWFLKKGARKVISGN